MLNKEVERIKKKNETQNVRKKKKRKMEEN